MSDRGPSDLLPEQFEYDLAGRILVAVMGTLSVLFVGLTGMRLAGPVAGSGGSWIPGRHAAGGDQRALPDHGCPDQSRGRRLPVDDHRSDAPGAESGGSSPPGSLRASPRP